MVEGLLRKLGFEIEPTINYDPHRVISNMRKDQRRKPFKHEEVVGLAEATNWYNYPKQTPKIVDLDEDSSSPMREVFSLFPYISNLMVAAESITPLAIQLEGKNKRYFPKAMDIDEEGTAETPKRQKVETEGKLLLDTAIDKGKRKIMISGPPFQVKEYTFADSTLGDSSSSQRTK